MYLILALRYLIKTVFPGSISSSRSIMVLYFLLTVLYKLTIFDLKSNNNIDNDVDNVDTNKYFFLVNPNLGGLFRGSFYGGGGGNSIFFCKNSTFTQSNSMRAVIEIFSSVFSFCKVKDYY